MSHKLTLWPSGEVLDVNATEPLMQQLKKAGKAIKSSCGGCATCSDCVIIVKSGEGNLTPPTFEELRLLGNVFHITKERLSCQTRLTGDATVDISAHEKTVSLSKEGPAKAPKAQVVVRKKDEVLEKQQARELQKQAKPKDTWHKHWEKTDEKDPDAVQRPKHLGGNKRPKPFTTGGDPDSET